MQGVRRMVNTITLKALRPELPTVIRDIDTRLDRYIITKRGKPVAVMMSVDDYEGFLETMEILADKEAVNRIRKSQEEIRKGKTVSLEALRRKIDNV